MQFQSKLLPQTISMDDVMKLVDTEEGDIVLLTDLMKHEDSSGISEISSTATGEKSDGTRTTANTSNTTMSGSTSTSSASTDSQAIVPSRSSAGLLEKLV